MIDTALNNKIREIATLNPNVNKISIYNRAKTRLFIYSTLISESIKLNKKSKETPC